MIKLKDISTGQKIFGSLYWRISVVFLIILTLVGLAYIIITVHTARIYFQQVNQSLNRATAGNISSQAPLFEKGLRQDKKIADMFHNIMLLNPSLEIYLLDTEGKILSYSAPEKKIGLKRIRMRPVQKFIDYGGKQLVKGDDPRHPGREKVFSAAAIKEHGTLRGYVYVVLASEEFDCITGYFQSDYLLQIGTRAMLLTLLFALVIGLVVIRFITMNLRKVIDVMQKFRQGNLSARIKVQSQGDVQEISSIFNEIADIFTKNIEELKEVEVLRRELIANVSHDLRTPISIIQGYSETLQMKEGSLTDEDRKRYLNTIYETTQNLEKLVNELFELSKLEANQVQPAKESFLISELVNDISSKYQLIAHKKNIILDTQLSKEQQPVIADLSLIERVIQNLLDNALKFTPAGGHIIIKTNKTGKVIEVSVSDSGIGIPDDEKEFVFGRYYKGHSFKKYQTGTGLGLAIAKKILDLHNSPFVLDSRINEGSSFAFELPLHQ